MKVTSINITKEDYHYISNNGTSGEKTIGSLFIEIIQKLICTGTQRRTAFTNAQEPQNFHLC